MMISFNKLTDLNQRVFRNIRGISLGFDEFDDLTSNPEARALAHRSAARSVFPLNKLQFEAIDRLFEQKTWIPSRFGNGKFPVWYSSLDLATSFHETIYHWHKRYIEGPSGYKNTETVRAQRSVFTVLCKAALIDLREHADKISHPDPASYSDTQQIGLRVHQEGYPGIITKSARSIQGENIAIFRKDILLSPEHHNNYIYEYNFTNNKVIIRDRDNNLIKLN